MKAKLNRHPVSHVKWVPRSKVRPNPWNPNKVAAVELELLHVSIAADGFTQPVVTVYDEPSDTYTVVDGFHRYRVGGEYEDVRESTDDQVPIVVLADKTLNDLMASTIRHNRARGKHGVSSMAQIVFEMLDNGWNEAEVCRELGMSADEILRLKHLSGFSKLFEGVEYRRAWETKRMARLRREWQAEHPDDPLP